MLKVLLRKQFTEVFKSYFYDAKKNRMRSKGAIAGWFVFFIVLTVGMLGGIFTSMSISLCSGLALAEMNWLYFLLMGGIAILFGAFGSVFNTYSGLYLPKDNDLLLSLPIPVRTIIAARLMNVYLMGTMYVSVVLLPALIVYWVMVGVTAARVICGILLFLIVSVIVLLLSCLLGRVVAGISLKLKNKSFVTVLIALLFIGVYYFFYFKANDLIRDIIENADVYGAKIKGAAYGLYLFGRIGEGDWGATAIFLAGTAVIFTLVWVLLSRSFLRIAAAGGKAEKVRYVEKRSRAKRVFSAVLGKEFARFTSSPNYMLNCGLGVLMLPAAGVLLLIKGQEFYAIIGRFLADIPDAAAVLLCTALCLVSSMNDMASPSVSLEGKSIWIQQSLPVPAKTVLRAKACVQIILTGVPMLFPSVCAAAIVQTTLAVRILLCVLPLVFTFFSAIAGTVIGVRMPVLNWTNELAPIKQSGAVMIALFGGWIVCAMLGGLYLLLGRAVGAATYLLVWTVVFAAAAAALQRWLDTKGAQTFAAL